jgi:hypothetical protein
MKSIPTLAKGSSLKKLRICCGNLFPKENLKKSKKKEKNCLALEECLKVNGISPLTKGVSIWPLSSLKFDHKGG